jgi:hypothetical protein
LIANDDGRSRRTRQTMPILESILITIGGSVAIDFFKDVMPADWKGEIAKELVGYGVK